MCISEAVDISPSILVMCIIYKLSIFQHKFPILFLQRAHGTQTSVPKPVLLDNRHQGSWKKCLILAWGRSLEHLGNREGKKEVFPKQRDGATSKDHRIYYN